ncbi:MAG: PEP-CTERM sorting domain-containing protein [Geminicoccaceae bacterium]
MKSAVVSIVFYFNYGARMMLRPLDVKSLCLAIGTFALAATSFNTPAHAVLMLTLDDGGATQTVVDTDGDGKVVFDGTLSNFTTNVSTGLSKPILVGAPTLIDLNSVNVSNNAGTLVIELSDTDFTNPTSYLFSAIGGTTNGSITYETFVNTSNGDPFDGTQIAQKTLEGAFFGAGNLFSIGLTGSDPYSLGIRVTINHESGFGQVTSFDSEIRVPEPGSLGLLGTGLLLAGLALSRRRKKR